MDMIKSIAAFLAAVAGGLFGSLVKALFQVATGRDIDAEAAARDEAERQEAAAQRAQADLEARHEEALAAAARTAAELRELRKEHAAQAERRARHEAFGRAHERAAEVRSIRWTMEPEPNSGAPSPA